MLCTTNFMDKSTIECNAVHHLHFRREKTCTNPELDKPDRIFHDKSEEQCRESQKRDMLAGRKEKR